MQGKELYDFIVDKLDDSKAQDIQVLDVVGKSTITDCMIVCTGTSSRHVNAIAERVVMDAKQANLTVLSMQGKDTGEWVLVDLGDIIIHVMQDETRNLYELEKLWGGPTVGASA
ncbi:ribosome silencing factor [Oceanisphaera profunda]|uniref:Ribosomal silencing factor RsfS n=1 Tax=Oceanisphaera profunda TaxID=1416627 RepID=A0A1Y0D6V7_9GAMM|nr:ribosome silencing factor [Oceanisphaera profunda]ART83281.1 ribosome silencing factor [Oceanisphaera profunda]